MTSIYTINRSPTSPLGEFKREGFGRQSMSEKRKGHIDPSRSEVYQRVKSSRQRGMFSILLQPMLIFLISRYLHCCEITYIHIHVWINSLFKLSCILFSNMTIKL